MKDGKYTSPDTSWFTRDRFGMFIHWGLYALGARHEWLKRLENIPDDEYQKYFERFDPDLYDPGRWAHYARKAGMQYVVLTAKHHEGFCLWDSQYTDYKATNTPYGKCLLTPFVEAFRKEGLKIGFYYSLLDWHHPEYTIDCNHPMYEDKEFRERENAKRDQGKYAAYMRHQVEELLSGFGEISLLWFDFSFPHREGGKGRDDWESEKLLEVIKKNAPEVLLNNRLDLPGAGDLVTPEQFQPMTGLKDEGGNPVVWEACQTFSGSWGYHRDEQTWKSVEMLLGMLIDGVSKGGNLLLNVGPTGRGEFDSRAVDRLEGIGKWMRTNARSIHGCGPAPEEFGAAPVDCRYTYNPERRRLYLHLMAWPFKAVHLHNMKGRVAYAQFLHDASEVVMSKDKPGAVHTNMSMGTPEGCLTLELPTMKPDITIPTIELFLANDVKIP